MLNILIHSAGHLLANLGFCISDFQICHSRDFHFCKICLEIMLVRYRGINKKGVLGGPWTIWKVLRAISSTLKCQFTRNLEFAKI